MIHVEEHAVRRFDLGGFDLLENADFTFWVRSIYPSHPGPDRRPTSKTPVSD
jgi:hypothetical protein